MVHIFSDKSFCVIQYPYSFIYNPETVPEFSLTGFVQNITRYAKLAKVSSTRHKPFSPAFDFRGIQNNRSFSRHPVISKVDCPSKKLTQSSSRKPLHYSEVSAIHMGEAINIFTPKWGNLFDLFAATATTVMAAICMSYLCVCNVGDNLRFDFANSRLAWFRKLLSNNADLRTNPSAMLEANAVLEAVQKVCNEEEVEDGIHDEDGLNEFIYIGNFEDHSGSSYKPRKTTLPEFEPGCATNLLYSERKIGSAFLRILGPGSGDSSFCTRFQDTIICLFKVAINILLLSKNAFSQFV